MDKKAKKILADECEMVDRLPIEMQSGGMNAELFLNEIKRLKSELSDLYVFSEKKHVSEQELNDMIKSFILKNVELRKANRFWLFKGKLKQELTANRIKATFVGLLEAKKKGNNNAIEAIRLFLEPK